MTDLEPLRGKLQTDTFYLLKKDVASAVPGVLEEIDKKIKVFQIFARRRRNEG